jgi:hypothetical protein
MSIVRVFALRAAVVACFLPFVSPARSQNSMNMALSNIAAALDALDDSHTFFLPPQHAMHHEYGWEYQMVGEHCFITEVRLKSDADAKAVKPGDELLSINGIVPTHDTTWKPQYHLWSSAAAGWSSSGSAGSRGQTADGGRNGKNSGNQTRYGSVRREWSWGYLEADP